MTFEELTTNDKMPRIFGKDYDDHIVFQTLEIIKEFYNTLSYCNMGRIETAAILSQSKVFSTIAYIYSSIEGTIESISVLLHNGRCNDAFALVRKYCDSIILDIYKHILVKEIEDNFHIDLSIDIIKTNRIKSWIDSEISLFNEKEIKQVYTKIAKAHPRLTTLFKLNDKNTLYHKLRDICNDNMHYNYLYNMIANDYEMIKAQKELRTLCINGINKAIVQFFTIHFAFIYECAPALFMSSDYIDYLDSCKQPPEGSERWVSHSVQHAFNGIIKTSQPLIAQYLQSLDLMDIE